MIKVKKCKTQLIILILLDQKAHLFGHIGLS